MELFPSTPDDPMDHIKGVIDDSDIYVLIVGGRYGSLHTSGKSFTEMELDYAKAKGIQILTLIESSPSYTQLGFEDQQVAFRERAKSLGMPAYWKDVTEFTSKFHTSVEHAIQRSTSPRWVRGPSPHPNSGESAPLDIAVLDKLVAIAWVPSRGHNGVPPVTVALRTIFKGIAPRLHGEISQENVRRNVGRLLFPQVADEDQKGKVTDPDFFRIRATLKSAGLIHIFSQFDPIGQSVDYWELTAKGERLEDEELSYKNR